MRCTACTVLRCHVNYNELASHQQQNQGQLIAIIALGVCWWFALSYFSYSSYLNKCQQRRWVVRRMEPISRVPVETLSPRNGSIGCRTDGSQSRCRKRFLQCIHYLSRQCSVTFNQFITEWRKEEMTTTLQYLWMHPVLWSSMCCHSTPNWHYYYSEMTMIGWN